MMKAVVGLGNPGDKYAHTRHNAGFDVMTILSEMLDIPIKQLKCRATVGEGRVKGERIVLIKPQTFMNLSGLCVADALSWYKIEAGDMLIVSDDIDLPFGQVRVRPHGGAGTHNGLRSIIECTGTDAFPRVRAGMGAPPPEWDLADYVLGHFDTEDARKIAFEMYKTAAEAAKCFLENDINLTMNRYNKRSNG